MQQVLFWIPLKTWLTPNGIPLYGFGTMLFLAFVASMWVAAKRSAKEGVSSDRLFDLAIWVFVCGIIGARIVFMIQYDVPLADWYKFWQGGIVFYGSAIGGWVGYGLAWLLSFRKYHIPTMKIADIIAPAVCVGLMVGRVGCLLNGCCYGHVCTDGGGLSYPLLTAPARDLVVGQGYQTLAGFTLHEANLAMPASERAIVGAIEPNSPAAKAGLERGDVIWKANDEDIADVQQLRRFFMNWPRGETKLALEVERSGRKVDLPPFTPRSLPLFPTQLFESISMGLLFFLLLAFIPYRQYYGEVFVVLMLGYAVHRFFNETLRDDTAPVLGNLTLSQVGSVGVFAVAIVLEICLRLFTTKVLAIKSASAESQPSPQANPQAV